MLVISRKEGQGVRIGDDICVRVVRLGSEHTRIGIFARSGVKIWRAELTGEITEIREPGWVAKFVARLAWLLMPQRFFDDFQRTYMEWHDLYIERWPEGWVARSWHQFSHLVTGMVLFARCLWYELPKEAQNAIYWLSLAWLVRMLHRLFN